MLIFAFVTLGAFFTYQILGTNKRLQKHQIEWDKIKENLTGDKFAVMKKGGKTAIIVLDSMEEVKNWMVTNGGDYFEIRRGNVHDAYMEYIDGLMKKYGGTILGACFPRM